ncbi:MAG: hypothetical protein IKM31_10740 [Oscillospiraceae bacterium]|nr:hypothetical protein [Oscillospiraceae bacterium]
MKNSRSGFGIFAAAFFVSLSLLLTAMGTVMTLTAREEPPPPVSSDLSVQSYTPAPEDALRMLVITDGPDFALFIADPMTASVRLISLPPGLAADEGTLLSRYDYAGGGEALLALSSIGIHADRWIRFTRGGAENIIDALGGMEWEFTSPLRTDRLDIPVGRHLLDGETVLEILSVEDDLLPEAEKISAALIGQRLTGELLNDSDRFFQVLTANTSGTLSRFDYQSRKKMFRWMLASDRYTLTWDSVRGEETDGKLILTDEEKSLLG